MEYVMIVQNINELKMKGRVVGLINVLRFNIWTLMVLVGIVYCPITKHHKMELHVLMLVVINPNKSFCQMEHVMIAQLLVFQIQMGKSVSNVMTR